MVKKKKINGVAKSANAGRRSPITEGYIYGGAMQGGTARTNKKRKSHLFI